MKLLNKFFLLLIFLTGAVSMVFANNLIPRQTLFGNPDKISVRLSHDGKYISYIAPKDGVLNVWIGEADKPLEARVITQDKDRGIRSYIWCYANEHILFVQDEKGDENFL